jgi:hypothetical protein
LNGEVKMLSREQLVDLYRELRESKVLSVYIDAGQTDPADRRAWSTALERGIADERRRVEVATPEDVEAFERARGVIDEALAGKHAFLQGRGWVGFATPERLVYGESLPVPMPDLVRWEGGLRAAPYVRALKQARMVVAGVADSRRARVFKYREGTLEECADLVADRDFGDLADSTSSPRAGATSGRRGEPGSDVASRLQDKSAARLRSELLDTVTDLVGREGFVIWGGPKEVVSALATESDAFGHRWIERPSMHLAMSEAEVRDEVEDAASELTRRAQARLLEEVIDAARSGGRGCLGIQATKEALREYRVDTVLMTRRFREDHADLADHFVGTAFEQGAAVEELSELPAGMLEAEGEGIAARLRYTT